MEPKSPPLSRLPGAGAPKLGNCTPATNVAISLPPALWATWGRVVASHDRHVTATQPASQIHHPSDRPVLPSLLPHCCCGRDPKKNATADALAWLKQYFQAFQDALEAPDWLRCGTGLWHHSQGVQWRVGGCTLGHAEEHIFAGLLQMQACWPAAGLLAASPGLLMLPRPLHPPPCTAAPRATPPTSTDPPGWTTSCSQRQGNPMKCCRAGIAASEWQRLLMRLA